MSKTPAIQGKATVSTSSPKPHTSKSLWTIDKVTKSATAEYLGGTLTISRRIDGILQGAYARIVTEDEGAPKTAPVEMSFSMGHIGTILEAQDHAEVIVRENFSRMYPLVVEAEDEKATAARVAEAGDEPF